MSTETREPGETRSVAKVSIMTRRGPMGLVTNPLIM